MEKHKKLLIISDTPMWRDKNGSINVYEPTLREVESLTKLFDEILWVGFSRPGYVFGNGRPSGSGAIRFKLLPPSGGHTLGSKLKSIFIFPYYWFVIFRLLIRYDHVHTRGPCVPALVAILLSFIFPKKKYWHKYAGNWGGTNAPFFYRLQKQILLKAAFSRVTLNGKWPDQRPHTLSFDNPCFSNDEINSAVNANSTRSFKPPFVLCFAGRLEEAKGVGNLIEAIRLFSPKEKIEKILMAGDGALRDRYTAQSRSTGVNFEFLGSVNRHKLTDIYSESHVMILPSASEGFPKVLAEASAFGCIPVITDISALRQTVFEGVNGFLMADNRPETIEEKLNHVLGREDLALISENARKLAEHYTYEKFLQRLKTEVFR